DLENRFPSRVSYQFLREKHFLNHLLRFYESYIGQKESLIAGNSHSVCSTSAAISSIRRWTVSLLRETFLITSAAGVCNTVLSTSLITGIRSSSPMVCALPLFAISKEILYDASRPSCSCVLDVDGNDLSNVGRLRNLSCSD
ncbi:hypothetical protein M514_17919, partial [Trichuris suis]